MSEELFRPSTRASERVLLGRAFLAGLLGAVVAEYAFSSHASDNRTAAQSVVTESGESAPSISAPRSVLELQSCQEEKTADYGSDDLGQPYLVADGRCSLEPVTTDVEIRSQPGMSSSFEVLARVYNGTLLTGVCSSFGDQIKGVDHSASMRWIVVEAHEGQGIVTDHKEKVLGYVSSLDVHGEKALPTCDERFGRQAPDNHTA